jgi:uncharacterized repeat protein (TIGR03806 family)
VAGASPGPGDNDLICHVRVTARALLLWSAVLLIANTGVPAPAPFEFAQRQPFTTSRLTGSPEPPLPFQSKRVFPELKLKHPLYIAHLPRTHRLLIVEQSQRIVSLSNVAESPTLETFCFVADHEIYSVAFHPGFATNHFSFVFANGPQSSAHKTNKIIRYEVGADTLRCNDGSRLLIIEWESNGHNGGDIAFGPDGMLYISSGDGTSDPDRNNTGQDLTDLTSGILRIDIDHPAGTTSRLYSVPADNPFIDDKGARRELWCYGLRNPWRIHFDEPGNLWVGDIGQDSWEMITVVQRGANYGWSVTEGSHPFQLQRQRGPTPISPPTIEHPHSEARSITGGIVYRGHRLPALRGAYIYGDYGTGRIWGARYHGGRVTWNELISDTPHQMLGFGEDPDGELLYADYAGGLYTLEQTPPSTNTMGFPQLLSETGLFQSVKDLTPHSGVIAYEVNAPYWADGAFQKRFMAIPGGGQIEFHERETWKFPEGSVLVQSLALEMKAGDASSRRWVETRLLLFQQAEWAAYSYQWNDEQTDAALIPGGDEREFIVADPLAPGGRREQTWYYPTRTECLTCHSRQAGFALGMNTWQMNRDHSHGGKTTNQILTLTKSGLIKESRRNPIASKLAGLPRLADPYDESQSITNRVRAYLHANCSHCHTEAGGGNSAMELTARTASDRMRIIDVRPQHDTFELPDARIIARAAPERSVMLHRMSQRGFGRMPPISIATVDERAVRLFTNWIRGLAPAE